MSILSIFSKGASVAEMKGRNAVVIDVRTAGEFAGGQVKGSKNYPLHNLGNKVEEIKKMNRPVIFCCASGMRSGQAASMFKRAGVDCINGGGWQSVARHY